jgi:xylulose-5-phosphate/fructose-6-phosphate phosphoketolase
MGDARLAARAYTREHGDDDPAIAGWTWPHQESARQESAGRD